MKRLVSTCHTGSVTGVNRRAGRGETCKHARRVRRGENTLLLKWAQTRAKRGNIHINRRQYLGLLEFTMQFERTYLINGVCVIKRPLLSLSLSLPPSTHARAADTHVHAAKFGETTQKISYLSRGLISCIMDLIVFAHCSRAPIRSERGCFILPLNVFPIDHCSKDVINNLRA